MQTIIGTVLEVFLVRRHIVASVDRNYSVIAFKRRSHATMHEAALSDQLTAYQLAEPNLEQLAFCVLVRTKEPKIERLVTDRSATTLREYLTKGRLVTMAIDAGHFYKRPGKWCSWCEFLPVCSGNTKRVNESIVQLR